MAKEPNNDQDAALTLKESTYKFTHRPSPQGCTMLTQQYKGVQYQLKKAHHDATVEKLELVNNETMYFVIK